MKLFMINAVFKIGYIFSFIFWHVAALCQPNENVGNMSIIMFADSTQDDLMQERCRFFLFCMNSPGW